MPQILEQWMQLDTNCASFDNIYYFNIPWLYSGQTEYTMYKEWCILDEIVFWPVLGWQLPALQYNSKIMYGHSKIMIVPRRRGQRVTTGSVSVLPRSSAKVFPFKLHTMMDLYKISEDFEDGWPWPWPLRSHIRLSEIFVSAIAFKLLKFFRSNCTQWWTCIKSRTSSKMGDLDLQGQPRS